MTKNASLFTPVQMGELSLPNRVVMAPLTRNRAQSDGVPGPLAATYYRQRASAGFIVTEATQISPMGKGYIDTPGLHSDAQVAGWREITDSVHAAGGRIFAQLWHVGRISHSSLLPNGAAPLSSTDKTADAKTVTDQGFVDTSQPQRMTQEQIKATTEDYRRAAENAKRAGFDGVEVHAANGYLLDQFLQNGVNDRDDAYGGTAENRMRFLLEVLDAVETVWPKGRIGVRLSPMNAFNDMSDDDPEALFSAVYKALDGRGLAYLHVVESYNRAEDSDAKAIMDRLRPLYSGFFVAANEYDGTSAADAIGFGHAQAVAFGRPFLANPDLPERLRRGADLNIPDEATFYGGGAEGYTDYPALET